MRLARRRLRDRRKEWAMHASRIILPNGEVVDAASESILPEGGTLIRGLVIRETVPDTPVRDSVGDLDRQLYESREATKTRLASAWQQPAPERLAGPLPEPRREVTDVEILAARAERDARLRDAWRARP
jgi:hypothetical protein